MRFLYARSIRQFLLILLLLALAPALVIISLSAVEHQQQVLRQTETNLNHLAESFALHQESLVLSTRQLLTTLGEIPSIRNRDQAASQALIARLHKQNQHYVNILTARPGREGLVEPANPPQNGSPERQIR